MADQALIVEPRHREYLVLQRGDIDQFSWDDDLWHEAYERRLRETFLSIKPFLPEVCSSVLDVGSGLGGMNILLNHHYGGGLHVCLLDGVNDSPIMKAHRRTFNNMEVAQDFLWKNGVGDFSFYSPDLKRQPRPFDLITSYRSWCFHYEPATYLQFVRACCHMHTTLIIDVRRGMPHWREALEKRFRLSAAVHGSSKCDRLVYKCLPSSPF